MISLHVYFNPKSGHEKSLENGISEKWITAMAKQKGFLKAVLLKKFEDSSLIKAGGKIPENVFEVISYWNSEEERLSWVAKPIHDQVFNPLIEISEEVSFTLQNVKHVWKF